MNLFKSTATLYNLYRLLYTKSTRIKKELDVEMCIENGASLQIINKHTRSNPANKKPFVKIRFLFPQKIKNILKQYVFISHTLARFIRRAQKIK